MLDQIMNQIIPGLVGAAGSGIPLYIALRKALAELRDSRAKLDVELERQKADNTNAQKINTEAEWRRVIDEKNSELVRLRAKDDEQEAKIADLLNRHIECQKSEARNEVKLANFENTTKEQAKQIKALTTKLLQLDKIVRGPNAPVHQGGSGTHEALLGIAGDAQEEARQPGGSVRPAGSEEVLRTEQGQAGGTGSE
jgi:hypothetical protein